MRLAEVVFLLSICPEHQILLSQTSAAIRRDQLRVVYSFCRQSHCHYQHLNHRQAGYHYHYRNYYHHRTISINISISIIANVIIVITVTNIILSSSSSIMIINQLTNQSTNCSSDQTTRLTTIYRSIDRLHSCF